MPAIWVIIFITTHLNWSFKFWTIKKRYIQTKTLKIYLRTATFCICLAVIDYFEGNTVIKAAFHPQYLDSTADEKRIGRNNDTSNVL